MKINRFWLTIIIWLFAAMFDSPESSQQLTNKIYELSGNTIVITPCIEMPQAVEYVIWIIILFLLLDGATLISKAFYSPQVMGDGLAHPYSFDGDVKRIDNFLAIRAGGSHFPIPYPGSHVLIAPLSYVRKVGPHYIIESQMTEKLPLSETPRELVQWVDSITGGLWGVKSMALGFFSTEELKKHSISPDSETSLQNWLIQERQANANFNSIYQLGQGKSEYLGKMLRVVTDIGTEEIERQEPKKSFLSGLFKQN